MTYSRAGSTTIGPGCLTAVFGKGTGVAIRVWSPGVSWYSKGSSKNCLCDPPRRSLEGGINAVKRSAVSTGRLSGSPRVHVRPIDLVVFQEPSPTRGRRPDLGGGFTLRCLQRLSAPYVATQRCPERDNWHTRGTSLPILSY